VGGEKEKGRDELWGLICCRDGKDGGEGRESRQTFSCLIKLAISRYLWRMVAFRRRKIVGWKNIRNPKAEKDARSLAEKSSFHLHGLSSWKISKRPVASSWWRPDSRDPATASEGDRRSTRSSSSSGRGEGRNDAFHPI